MASSFDTERALKRSNELWETEILPTLCEYIRIPNVSPDYDKDWKTKGHMGRAVRLLSEWAQSQPIQGLTVGVVELEERTPLIFMEIPGTAPGTVLLYGHLDKQPEMTGWRDGLSAWKPVREADRLYGRGGADDGYSIFASLAAIRLLQEQNIPHAPCVVLIEACEESGSFDLPAYIDLLAFRIGNPELVICLDSGCGDYDRLWMTTSLRGVVGGVLRVEVLTEGFHSGAASGVVADPFRILRILLNRLESEQTGLSRLKLETMIPEDRITQAMRAQEVLGGMVLKEFPWKPGVRPVWSEPLQILLSKTWRPALTVTGFEGLPIIAEAGNVLRPWVAAKLSMRIPPNIDPKYAAQEMKKALEDDPPYGAHVSFTPSMPAGGWNAPVLAPWLEKSVGDASRAFFGKPAMAMGEGGTIPFMSMLGKQFPGAQFLITGVLGPESNAHGPNEFLHIPTGRRLTGCVASVLADHALR